VVNLKLAPRKISKAGHPRHVVLRRNYSGGVYGQSAGIQATGSLLPLMELLGLLSVPDNAPAKFHGDPIAYLHWIASKVRKRRK